MIQRIRLAAILCGVMLATPVSAELLTPVSVYDHSGYTETFAPELAIDGLTGSTSAWVSQDDTGTPMFNPPVTGHIVLDMGEATDINAAMLWARGVDGSYNPRDVVFYYFEDDNPANILGSIDDVEGDPNITAAWQGTLDPLASKEAQPIAFDTTVTKRYIGMRIDSSYAPMFDNFQIGELAFGTAVIEDVPGVAPVSVFDYSDYKINYVPELTFDAKNIVDGKLFPEGTYMWVAQDDTGSPGSAPPVTGHIVYDMGSPMTLSDMTMWSRVTYINYVAPEHITIFGFADDNPYNRFGEIDDVENDPNIVELWSGTLVDSHCGFAQTVTFDTPYTGQYIGVRIDSSYEPYDDNFQIEEIRFNTDGYDPEPLPGIAPTAIYDASPPSKDQYKAERLLDGQLFDYNLYVCPDDNEAESGVNGHVIFDFGEAMEITDATLWSRARDESFAPKDVKFFAFADDDPTHILGAIDDIENDPNIIELWSGTLSDITNGETADIFFTSAFTGRYIGMRVDSSYRDANFHLTEIRFNAAEGGPTLEGDLNGDGTVSGADLDIIRGNWGASVTPGDIAAGDPSGDGLVGGADLDIIRANWGHTAATAVPEPGVLVLLLCAAAGLLVRRP